MATVIISVVTTIIVGVAVWWFTQPFAIKRQHQHRIIEEHTKKLQEYTEKYYMKHAAYAASLQEQFERIVTGKGTTAAIPPEGIVFNLFTIARRRKLEEEWWKDTSAILLLKDRTGEAVLSELANQVEGMIIGEKGFMTAQDDAKLRFKVTSHENLSEFIGKISSDPVLKDVAQKYVNNVNMATIDSLYNLIRHFNCLQRIYYFEVNACFDPWYGEEVLKPKLDGEDWKLLEKILNTLIYDGQIDSPAKSKYLSRLGKSLATKQSSWGKIWN